MRRDFLRAVLLLLIGFAHYTNGQSTGLRYSHRALRQDEPEAPFAPDGPAEPSEPSGTPPSSPVGFRPPSPPGGPPSDGTITVKVTPVAGTKYDVEFLKAGITIFLQPIYQLGKVQGLQAFYQGDVAIVRAAIDGADLLQAVVFSMRSSVPFIVLLSRIPCGSSITIEGGNPPTTTFTCPAEFSLCCL
eukprot:CAMPEP_0202906468 /NCGR_PEP_ID=MMETSP1392-20130828/39038_1 /ASSEMBLY_ACC=CAM_ASM_000868 /TAXON_ID=225041 /ORGANISM="Chlamydomonas chlamydogama, Strain SAG 11-48b" /LENGTH=187 /DNA_ID=CAMNT_0049594999 /DNA_START=228 /DNA_END=787 /DNA_ORIENTATION=-